MLACQGPGPGAARKLGQLVTHQLAFRLIVIGVDRPITEDVTKDRRRGAALVLELVVDPLDVLLVDHAVVREVARQNIEATGIGNDVGVADRDRDPVRLRDRLGEAERVRHPQPETVTGP